MSGICRAVIIFTVGLATGSVLTALVISEDNEPEAWIDSPELVERGVVTPFITDGEAQREPNVQPETESVSIGVHMDPDAPETWPLYQGDRQPANIGDRLDPDLYHISRIPDNGGEVGGWIGTPEEEAWAQSGPYQKVEIGEFEPVDDPALGDGTD